MTKTKTLGAAFALCALFAGAAGADIGEPQRPRMIQTADAVPSKKEVQASIRAQDWAKAESQLLRVVEAKAKDPAAWYFLAQVEDKLGKRAEARAALEQATSLDPTLKFASPGAIESLQRRLGMDSRPARSERHRPEPTPMPAPSAPISGYGDRPAVGSASPTPILAPSRPAADSGGAPLVFGLLFVAAALAVAIGGAVFMTKRQKTENERERRGLLARANTVQERATALSRTARFEGQESSAFGVAAKSIASKATSTLGRLNSISASFDAHRERRTLSDLERDIEALENQAARQAWNEEPVKPAQPGAGAPVMPPQPSGQALPPVQQGGHTTVVVDRGPDLLSTAFALASALSSQSRERDLERQLERERDRNHGHGSREEPSSSFDFGSGDSDWADKPSSGFDSGPSNSSDWSDGPSRSNDDDKWK